MGSQGPMRVFAKNIFSPARSRHALNNCRETGVWRNACTVENDDWLVS